MSNDRIDKNISSLNAFNKENSGKYNSNVDNNYKQEDNKDNNSNNMNNINKFLNIEQEARLNDSRDKRYHSVIKYSIDLKNNSDLKTFNFNYIDFSKLDYFSYIYYKAFCSNKTKVYDAIKKEIEHLLDFLILCNFLKHQYLLKDPDELKE